MRYGEGGVEHRQTANHVISEEVIGYLVFHLLRDHLGVLRRLFALTTPSSHPLWCGLREDGTELDQKSSIAVAIIEIGK